VATLDSSVAALLLSSETQMENASFPKMKKTPHESGAKTVDASLVLDESPSAAASSTEEDELYELI
jgi:hypothetical protein